MLLEILTPEKKIFSGEVTLVQFPGTDGLFEILNNHTPMISSLCEGRIKYQTQTETHVLKITSGFMECLNNKVSVLAEGIID